MHVGPDEKVPADLTRTSLPTVLFYSYQPWTPDLRPQALDPSFPDSRPSTCAVPKLLPPHVEAADPRPFDPRLEDKTLLRRVRY